MFKKKCLTDIEKIMDELEAENLAFLQDDSSQCSTGRGALKVDTVEVVFERETSNQQHECFHGQQKSKSFQLNLPW